MNYITSFKVFREIWRWAVRRQSCRWGNKNRTKFVAWYKCILDVHSRDPTSRRNFCLLILRWFHHKHSSKNKDKLGTPTDWKLKWFNYTTPKRRLTFTQLVSAPKLKLYLSPCCLEPNSLYTAVLQKQEKNTLLKIYTRFHTNRLLAIQINQNKYAYTAKVTCIQAEQTVSNLKIFICFSVESQSKALFPLHTLRFTPTATRSHTPISDYGKFSTIQMNARPLRIEDSFDKKSPKTVFPRLPTEKDASENQHTKNTWYTEDSKEIKHLAYLITICLHARKYFFIILLQPIPS